MALELIKSDRTIQALKPGIKRLNDGGGLYLLPFAKGESHYWRFDYTFEGKRKTISLGVYPATGLSLARAKAVTARFTVAAGQDPSNERKQHRSVIVERVECERRLQIGEAPLGSFEEVARRWFDVKKDEWMESYSSKVLRRLELHALPQFGQRLLEDITPKVVLDACRIVEKRGTWETAHRVRELCSAVFCFAIAEGKDLTDPCRDIRNALKRPETKHFAAVTRPTELAGLLRSIEAYGGTFVVQCALKLTPMLMVRPGELRQARWESFDLDNGLWYIPSALLKRTKEQKKSGEPHLVPLPKQAVEILEELFKLTSQTGIVFPCEGRSGRFMSDGTINTALRSMGYSSDIVTGHGFRATARTLVVELLRFPEEVAEMQLAHAVKDANGTAYNRAEFLEMRIKMMQAWADYLEDLRLGRSKVKHLVLPEFKPVTARLAANQAIKPQIA